MARAFIAAATFIFLLQSASDEDYRLQQVIATVRDADGWLVRDLTAEDFIIEENGVPQEIAFFVEDTEIPVSVGLLIDTSGSMAASGSAVTAMAAASGTARVLLDVMKPGDEFLLMSFDTGVNVRQAFTSDRSAIAAELRKLQPAGGTNLFESLRSALNTVNRSRPRNRGLVVITDAAAIGDYGAMAREVRRAEIAIYTFGIRVARPDLLQSAAPVPANPGAAMPPPGTTAGIELVLEALASESGGRSKLFDIHSETIIPDMIAFVQEIASELRGQYTLGYYRAGELSGRYAIRLRTENPAYHVRMRRFDGNAF